MREKLKRIFERTDKDYLTLATIKKLLKINKKDGKEKYEKKCHDLIMALTDLINEGYIKAGDSNRFYKRNFMKSETLESKIMSVLEAKGAFTLKELTNVLKNYPITAIEKKLESLELEGKIFCNAYNRYEAFPSNFFIAEIQCNKKGFKFIEVENRFWDLNTDDFVGLLPFDIAVFSFENHQLCLKKILKRGNREVVCEISDQYPRRIKVVDNDFLPVSLSLKSLNDQNISLKSFPEGTRILVNISTEQSDGVYNVDFIEQIGHKNDLDAELTAIGYNNGFRIHYTKEELEQVKSIPNEIQKEDLIGRQDFRNSTIFTIDGENTKDMDDAVSIKKLANGNYLLNVSIADVAHYIKPSSPLWKRAEHNTTSLYLIDSVSHMLHPNISNGICSLNPGVDRLAKSFLIEIDSCGNIVDFTFENSIIRSKKKMTYEQVNELLEQNIVPEGYEEFIPDLLLMQELSTILSERRRRSGALDFDSKEIHYVLDEDKNVEEITTTKCGLAQKLIENFMITTNEGMANYMLNLGIDFIYRNHYIPFKEKLFETINLIKGIGYRLESAKNIDDPYVIQKIIQSLNTKEEFFIFSSLLLRSMQKAYYSTENQGHYGLALNAYSQTTSPIRRFLDLVIQTILDNLDTLSDPNTNIKEFKNYLSEVCKRASIMERFADKAEYEANKLYMLNYIESRKDEEFDAYVNDITPNYIVVKIPNLVEGVVMTDDIDDGEFTYSPQNKWLTNAGSKIVIGSKVKLRVKECDKEHRIIYFYALSPERIQENILKRTQK